MTVKELIAYLNTVEDQDAVVTYQACSDLQVLDEKELSYVPKKQRKFVLRKDNTHQTVFAYNERQRPADMSPRFVSVVRFPGN
jgi:hypothetical protein